MWPEVSKKREREKYEDKREPPSSSAALQGVGGSYSLAIGSNRVHPPTSPYLSLPCQLPPSSPAPAPASLLFSVSLSLTDEITLLEQLSHHHFFPPPFLPFNTSKRKERKRKEWKNGRSFAGDKGRKREKEVSFSCDSKSDHSTHTKALFLPVYVFRRKERERESEKSHRSFTCKIVWQFERENIDKRSLTVTLKVFSGRNFQLQLIINNNKSADYN